MDSSIGLSRSRCRERRLNYVNIVCLSQSGTDWRADGYRWRQNGTSAIPKQKPVIRKIHFDNIISTGSNKSFRKFVYSNADEDKPEYVVVQYVGDASSVENFPHGKYQPVVDAFQGYHTEATRLGFSQRRRTWGVVCKPVLFRFRFFCYSFSDSY